MSRTTSSSASISTTDGKSISDVAPEPWRWPDASTMKDFKEAADPQQSVINWGLEQSRLRRAKDEGIRTNVLAIYGSNPAWYSHLSGDGIVSRMKFPSNVPDDAPRILKICFIDTLQAVGGELPGNFSFRPSTIQGLQSAGCSPLLLSNIYTESSHWAKMGNQQLVHRDVGGVLDKFELCYQYRYGWSEPLSTSYIHGIHEQSASTYFCINYPADARATLIAMTRKEPSSVRGALLIDFLAADSSLKQWQRDIHARRQFLMEKEQLYKGMDLKTGFEEQTRDLHQMSKEWLALREDLVTFHAQLAFLSDAHSRLSQLSTKAATWNFANGNQESNPFDVLVSQAEVCARWTTVYRDRTDICIQMLFHLSNQRIAQSSRQIAHQTQKDSASMITLAAVTMLFLPGTFISAILSTTVFDYGHESVQVSNHWWILVATTVPLTLGVFLFWLWWQYVWVSRRDGKEREVE